MSYGREDNPLHAVINPRNEDEMEALAADMDNPSRPQPQLSFKEAARLSHNTCKIVFKRTSDPNVLTFVHITVVFVLFLTRHPEAMALIENEFPWELLSQLLNSLLQTCEDYERIASEEFPRPAKEKQQPLPEDYAMRRMGWADKYMPKDWFDSDKIDPEEHDIEKGFMTVERKERILWIAYRIAEHGKWLLYDEDLRRFQVAPEYQSKVEDVDMGDITDQYETMSVASTLATGLTSIETKKGDDKSEMEAISPPDSRVRTYLRAWLCLMPGSS